MGSSAQADPEMQELMKKIEEGKASTHELFIAVDEDKSGMISKDEYSTLARRLGMNLSQHRVNEIFASLKQGSEDEDNLNEQEFGKAMEYLQQKNTNMALDFLGLSPALLTISLIFLGIILILIFIFIFLGIQAFALGGTFGSVVNSLMPFGNISLHLSPKPPEEEPEPSSPPPKTPPRTSTSANQSARPRRSSNPTRSDSFSISYHNQLTPISHSPLLSPPHSPSLFLAPVAPPLLPMVVPDAVVVRHVIAIAATDHAVVVPFEAPAVKAIQVLTRTRLTLRRLLLLNYLPNLNRDMLPHYEFTIVTLLHQHHSNILISYPPPLLVEFTPAQRAFIRISLCLYNDALRAKQMIAR